MYKAKYLSPMIPSFDIRKTVSFFIGILQFRIERDEEAYVILSKDNLTVHVLKAGADIGEMEFYLEVDDIEKVWNGLKSSAGDLKIKEPFNRDYGMREIHVIIPQTKTLIFIGQELRSLS